MSKGTLSHIPVQHLSTYYAPQEYHVNKHREGNFWLPVAFTLFILLLGSFLAFWLATPFAQRTLFQFIGTDMIEVGRFQLPTLIVSATAVGLFLILGLLVAQLLRWKILKNQKLCAEDGCPSCRQQELIRTKRSSTDRLLNNYGMPVYRYACRNCQWQGRRLGLLPALNNHSGQSFDYELRNLGSARRAAPKTFSPPENPSSLSQTGISQAATLNESGIRPASSDTGASLVSEDMVEMDEQLGPMVAAGPTANDKAGTHVAVSFEKPVVEPVLLTAKQQNQVPIVTGSAPADFDPEEFERLCLAAVRRDR
ncbi:MAG: hypothetical protein ACK2UK_15700 [Candidatus Promineifilaceae bacterium]